VSLQHGTCSCGADDECIHFLAALSVFREQFGTDPSVPKRKRKATTSPSRKHAKSPRKAPAVPSTAAPAAPAPTTAAPATPTRATRATPVSPRATPTRATRAPPVSPRATPTRATRAPPVSPRATPTSAAPTLPGGPPTTTSTSPPASPELFTSRSPSPVTPAPGTHAPGTPAPATTAPATPGGATPSRARGVTFDPIISTAVEFHSTEPPSAVPSFTPRKGTPGRKPMEKHGNKTPIRGDDVYRGLPPASPEVSILSRKRTTPRRALFPSEPVIYSSNLPMPDSPGTPPAIEYGAGKTF
jgi:hypothetical protein